MFMVFRWKKDWKEGCQTLEDEMYKCVFDDIQNE